ncbi:MAG: DNA repair protein RecO [Oscillospiraceae bacterium]|nr:DNA repair protein RecO [Oscillospiraceae bacterium]
MQLTTVSGLVIRERQSGDNDKFLDILTETDGVVEVMAKGVKKYTCPFAAASQLYAYSRFCLSYRRGRYYIDSAEPVKIFYSVREELERFSLVSYFSEVISFCQFPDKENSRDILRLFLNILHYLTEGTREMSLLKSIFELRLMSETGHMPDVVGCSMCRQYQTDKMYFSAAKGNLYCENCYSAHPEHGAVCIGPSVLHAVRHIVLTDFDRLFNFKLSGDSMAVLSDISEQYLLIHLGRSRFKTLDFYNSLC